MWRYGLNRALIVRDICWALVNDYVLDRPSMKKEIWWTLLNVL